MSSSRFWLVLVFFISLLLVSTGASVADEESPDEIIFDNSYKQERKGPVTFSHFNHAEDYGLECTDCHHDYEDGVNIWQEGDPVNKCIECHDPDESDEEIKNLRLSFHRNCKGCHKQLYEEEISEDAPFRKCSGCHE